MDPYSVTQQGFVSYWNHWPLQSAGRNGGGGSVAEGEVAENEARASVSSELIGELLRKGVLAGDMGNGMLQRLAQPSDCAGVLSPQ
jgi:hypothetical protein